MYSVIIMNQKTMEAFSQYQLLFNDTFCRDQVGICKWNESGRTLDTALPEIASLTLDKEEWRAIIVRFIDDAAMGMTDSTEINPYDFLVNAEDTDLTQESPVPIIRSWISK